MVEISESLRTVYTGEIEDENGRYVIQIPSQEIENESVTLEQTYRIAILESASTSSAGGPDATNSDPSDRDIRNGPPVEEGEIRPVEVESIGDQGDGIAKIAHGYVVIVPGTEPGDTPTVEITNVQDNVAFADVVDNEQSAT